MGGYVVESTDDLEPDAYDKVRQKEIDNVTITYPDDATLHARGKYSSLASERRDLRRKMREELESIMSYAGRTLRTPDDTGWIGLQVDSMRNVVDSLATMQKRLSALQTAINELKPAAWGDKYVE